MIDFTPMLEIRKERERIINEGTVDELIKFAKQYNIHQEGGISIYVQTVNRIKTRLIELGVDPETVRSE
jgi:cob(I)alamin adenosyltransferase